jgi:hypothetical protein
MILNKLFRPTLKIFCRFPLVLRLPGTRSNRTSPLNAVLWNRNDFLRFRFQFLLLKSYGSGSGSDF